MADQPEIFFVASSGGAATKWLSNILSSVSEDVLCYHGAELSRRGHSRVVGNALEKRHG